MAEKNENSKNSESTPSEFVGPRERLASRLEKPDPVQDIETEEKSVPETSETSAISRWQRFRRWCFSHKKISIPATILVLLIILAAIPFTRYKIAAVLITHDINIQVLDSKTGSPVSLATVKSGNVSAITSGSGVATLPGIKAGKAKISVSKNHYKDGEQELTVPVLSPDKDFKASLSPTGRLVKVSIKNFVNQKPLADVEIKAADIKAKTDASGNALLVLPVGPHQHQAELKLNGYNDAKLTLEVSDTEIKQNDFQLTPYGKVYFLQDRSGRLDVMKANLDGSDLKTVLAGTGFENAETTILVASPDWRHIALLARRDNSKPKVYVLSASDDKLNIADEGSADFALNGWIGDHLVLTASRTDVKPWQTGSSKLKSYNAGTGKLTTLDQTTGDGDAGSNIYEYYSFVYLSGELVSFGKGWTSQTPDSADYTGKEETLSSISAGGQNGRKAAGYDAAAKTVDYAVHLPSSVYLLVSSQGSDQEEYFDYKAGETPQAASLSFGDFYGDYPNYYLSPDGKHASWSEPRDGKSAVVVGESDGTKGTAVASLDSNFRVFGWYSSEYLLVSSESKLFIMGVDGGTPHKITDFGADNYYMALFP